MMRKKTSYTNITPIPAHIPRQLAIDILQAHGEVIELNPLVTGFEGIKAPRDAPADEYYATWYEISQRIQYIPGIGKLGSGSIKFKGCFHDMPWGLQTHIYAPAGVDLRNKWQICGNQPGEPVEPRELGIDAPPDGLYLREDIEIKCNMTMVGFVKKETKVASKTLVERLIKKAELLDAGVLQGMMNKGKLVTRNPADRSSLNASSPHTSPYQQPPLPAQMTHYNIPASPHTSPKQPAQFHHQHQRQQSNSHYTPPDQLLGTNNVVMELPGDFYHSAQTAQPSSPGLLNPQQHQHQQSPSSSPSLGPPTNNNRWSHSTTNTSSSSPTSYTSDANAHDKSTTIANNPRIAELPAMAEDPAAAAHQRKYEYNPQDFVAAQQQRPRSYEGMAPPPLYSKYGAQTQSYPGQTGTPGQAPYPT